MAYDETVAARLRTILADEQPVEKKAFGGLAFMIAGNMALSASSKGGVMLRCRPEQTDAHVARGAERMVMRGKAMDGWLHVAGQTIATDADLAHWAGVGVDFARSLPPK